MKINVKRINPHGVFPRYSVEGDAGADLFSCENGTVHARSQRLVNTGIALEIPYGFVGIIRPRSGLSSKYAIGMNSSGVIDSGYRGEIKVNLVNHSDQNYSFGIGDKIAQILIMPVIHSTFHEVDKLSESQRSINGFGSTGK